MQNHSGGESSITLLSASSLSGDTLALHKSSHNMYTTSKDVLTFSTGNNTGAAMQSKTEKV